MGQSNNINANCFARRIESANDALNQVSLPDHFNRVVGLAEGFAAAVRIALSFHTASWGRPACVVTRPRQEGLNAYRQSVSRPSGFFFLTILTGERKTFSSWRCAFNHARHHGLSRVIGAIPLTSIIRQVASLFEGVFGNLPFFGEEEGSSWLDPFRNKGPAPS